MPVPVPISGSPAYPDLAPGSRWNVPTGYDVLISGPTHDNKQAGGFPSKGIRVSLFGSAYAHHNILVQPTFGWVVTPALADANKPDGYIHFPDWAPGPTRTSFTAYDASLGTNITDRILPAGQPSYPVWAPPPNRASFTTYDAALGAEVIVLQPPGMIHFPFQAPAPIRAAFTAYDASLGTNVTDGILPAGQIHFPFQAPPPVRAPFTAYDASLGTNVTDGILPVGQIHFPFQAPPPIRTAFTAYDASLGTNLTDGAQPSGMIHFPVLAPAPLRAAFTAYAGISVFGPIQPPPFTEPRNQVWPDFARGPLWAAYTAYTGLLSKPQIPDNLMPAGSPFWLDKEYYPDRALGKWAPYTEYAGLKSAPNPVGSIPSGRPVYIDFARGSIWSPTTAYTVSPQIGDKIQPPGRDRWPDQATVAARASVTAYTAFQGSPFELAVPVGTGRPAFSDRAPDASRTANTAYTGLLSHLQIADKAMPPPPPPPHGGHGHTHKLALWGPYTSYITIVAPMRADARQPVGVISVPPEARTAARTANTAYAGLLSAMPPADVSLPSGQPVVADPRRRYLRAPREAYRALLSGQMSADVPPPAGTIIFPGTAPGPRLADQTAYDHRVVPQIASVFNLHVSCDLNLAAYCNLGQTYTLTCTADFNLAAFVSTAGIRYRQGDVVNLTFTTPPGLLLSPHPTVTIRNPSTGVIATLPAWTWTAGQTFQVSFVLTIIFPPDTYTASIVLLTSDGTFDLQTSFDVVPGGDIGSNIIAMHSREDHQTRTMIVQLQSGFLVKGNDPWI